MKPGPRAPTKCPNPEYAGPYRLMDTIGKGGLATVKVGLEFASGTRVAVKIINKEKLVNTREQVSMAREITIMNLLKHKNILRLYNIYENDEKIFLILDLYEGGDLYGYLTQKGARPPSEALFLFKQIIAGVEYCHKCMIVHRDLKPENLLLSADLKHLVISDFGLSTGMQGSRNLLKTRCGTVHYISPEVAKGDPYVGMASDIWSVGIILYAMVTASLPFDGPNSIVVLKKIVRGAFSIPDYVPKELQDLIRLMLTLDPTERITIPQIKQHPWFMGADDTPRSVRSNFDDPEEPYVITTEELQQNSDVLYNLRLLGWEENELMNELMDTKKNMAKAFYKLLIEQKKGPTTTKDKTDAPQNIDRKVLRRRSIASPVSLSRIGVASDLSKSPSHTQSNHTNNPISKSRKRASTRTNQNAPQLPVKTTTTTQPRTRRKSSVGQPPSPPLIHAINHQNTPPPDHSPKASNSGVEKNKNVIWSTSTGTEADSESSSNSKEYQIEANKSVTQILEALKHCFADLGQFDLSAKQTKNGIKVKARRSGKRHGPALVTVNFTQKDEHSSLRIKKGKSKEDFKELIKKVEETLVV